MISRESLILEQQPSTPELEIVSRRLCCLDRGTPSAGNTGRGSNLPAHLRREPYDSVR